MLKKALILFTISVFCGNLNSQTNTLIKKLFFELPLDSSRECIYKTLKTDKRFISKNKNDNIINLHKPSFIGNCIDNGLALSNSDSIEVELTYAFTYKINEEFKKLKSNNQLVIKIRYYYDSADTTKKEYDNLLKIVRTISKDSCITGVDTIYSSSNKINEFKAKGLLFKHVKPEYNVEILNVKVAQNYFGVFLTYTRKEN